ncbi:middle transcription regulatory protein [Brevundimonas phage vB_BpoS-Kikimora]|uniref:Middle transcription regulatory protein n=1 Tax=Brevundimonas phage vB_BpoS-Kikimora TaxID=2948601 RepID=A0A9E7SMU3_9CAUD|nr:middle transcription regulatory protein [Brevundimonas phage vB_BpoS-Kikimora]
MVDPFLTDEDGASAIVKDRPSRRVTTPKTPQEIAAKPAGGRMKAMSEAGTAHRTDFVILRKVGRPAARLYLPHAVFFKGLWQLWSAKRITGEPDPGVTQAEMRAWMEENVGPTAASSVTSAMRALVRSRAVRSVQQHVGFRAIRMHYYPTSEGVEILALAEVLGDGSFVQVGRTRAAWKNRAQDEPRSVFEHAQLL